MNRNGIGIDINANAIDITKKRTQFSINNSANIKLFLGDAQNLNMIKNNSIDFICTHPPYANIIKYIGMFRKALWGKGSYTDR